MYRRPDDRLCSALPYLKRGGRIADVGTDHAYLPVYLVGSGHSSFAVASDLRKGPLERAERNVQEAGLSDKISLVLCDGLSKIEPYRPDDILIFGMGGELIASILDAAPWVKNSESGLILQPMSRQETLRRYLLEQGFSILGESLTFVDRIYQTIYARYTGESEQYTDEELLLGRLNLQNKPPLLRPLIEREIHILGDVIEGKRCARAANTARDEGLLSALQLRLEEL